MCPYASLYKLLSNLHRLDVLILNAGIGGQAKRTLTSDNLELTMATNHFGHFLLTNLLLGKETLLIFFIFNVNEFEHVVTFKLVRCACYLRGSHITGIPSRLKLSSQGVNWRALEIKEWLCLEKDTGE